MIQQADPSVVYFRLDAFKHAAKRFNRPIFLSLDLAWLNTEASGISDEMSGKWLLLLEKELVKRLGEALEDASTSASAQSAGLADGGAINGEMVGR